LSEPAEVFSVEIPAGRVATALHIGPNQRLGETHAAIHAWAVANKASFAGKPFAGKSSFGESWEIYGDWTDDAAKLETRVEYLLS
jgi:hypothetical protein